MDYQSDAPESPSSSSVVEAVVPLSGLAGLHYSGSATPPVASSLGVQTGSLLKSVVMKKDEHQVKKSTSSSSSPSSSSSSTTTTKEHRHRSPVSEPIIGYSAFEEKKLAKPSYAIWGDTHWAVGGGGGVSVATFDYDFDNDDFDDDDSGGGGGGGVKATKQDEINAYEYLTSISPQSRINGGRGSGFGGGEGYGGWYRYSTIFTLFTPTSI